tara:strand:- start:198 stop:1661 length:1464 start_codon:yes stop_codon:yes gene_type:complete
MTKLEMTDAMKKVVKARVLLMQESQGVASMLIELDLVELSAEECPTMATDGKRIFFSSDWVLQTPMNELKSVVFHEGCHVIWEHPIRRRERDPYWFNIACDIVINNWIKYDLKMTLPSDGVWDWKHRNKTPEDVYRNIMSDQEEKQSLLDQLSDLNGDTNDSDESNADDCGGGEDDGSDDGKSDTSKIFSDGDSTGGQASGAPTRDERPVLSGEVWDLQDDDGNKANKDEAKEFAKVVRSTASLNATLEKAVGNDSMGDAMVSAINANLDSEVDWVELLRDFLVSTVANDPTWSRLNKRHQWRGINLPSKQKSAEGGELAIAIDTSGSVSQYELDQFATEVEALCLDCGIDTIRVCYCDTEYHDTRNPDEVNNYDRTFIRKRGSSHDLTGDEEWWQTIEVGQGEEVKLYRIGGGGTDFDPPFNLFNNHTDDAEDCVAMIYFTDGYGEVSAEVEPDVPVLWAMTTADGMNEESCDAFGEKVRITFDNY